MKKNNLFIPFLITILSFIVFFVLNIFNIFNKFDYRVYDALFHVKKETSQNENVTLIKADDPSIEAFGEWPWSRDILGDVLVRLKEFDSKFAVFDIEYISPSKNGIAPSAEQNVINHISELQDNVNSNISVIPNSRGQDLNELVNELINVNNDQFEELKNYVNNHISRDNDEYFAQTIQFNGNAWLTVNHTEMGYKTSQDDFDYIYNRFLLKNVEDENGLLKIENEYNAMEINETLGFTPALHKLLTRAKGVSFTNSFIDKDGTRRRIELLFSQDERYLPQLVFGPLVDLYQVTDIVKQKNKIILKNAKNPETGNISDIEIPLDNHGRLLINYRKNLLDDSFKTESIFRIINLDLIESQIIPCLSNILNDKQIFDDNNDFLPYFYDAYYLYDSYNSLVELKNQLLEKCKGFDENNKMIDGISKEEYAYYFDLRNDFFNSLESFVNKKYLNDILTRIDELKLNGLWDGTEQDIDYFTQDFTDISKIYSQYNILFNELSAKLKNSYCIIGQTATSTTDLGATPLLLKFENIGIHANVMNTILNQDFIKYINWYWGFIAAFILLIIVLLIPSNNNAFQNTVNGLLIIGFLVFFIIQFVVFNIYSPFVGTILYLFINFLILVAYRYFVSSKEKKLITAIASSFANKDTVEELRKNPELFSTKGEKKPITALFSDVQSFSTLSEKISKIYGDEGPNKLIGILNEYLGQMSNEILANNGTIDKYEGDAIISMFGAPDPLQTHSKEEWAYLTLDSAIRMKKVEMEFNEQHKDLFKPVEIINSQGKKEIVQLDPLKTRIGINSGFAYVGLMGSKTESFSKLNYTMIGDTVNLASRLEGVNKLYKTWIMCSGETWNLANSGANAGKLIARKLDRVRVVGRNTPVEIYNVLGFADEFTHLQKEQLDIFNVAMDEYLAGNFTKAGKLFMQASSIQGLEDPTCLVFAERCKKLIENGCPKDWDFVINMTSK